MRTLWAIFATISVFGKWADAENQPVRAIAYLAGNIISGTVHFTQNGCNDPVLVSVNVTGLTANRDHGFHIHETGDLSNGCLSLAAHLNPYTLNHGGPDDDVRHIGDLGNIRGDVNGRFVAAFSDSVITLLGSQSIVGRGVIIHQNPDDLGRGGQPDSLTTGNAGPRVVCAIVGYADANLPPECPRPGSGSNKINSSAVTPIVLVIGFLSYKWN